MHHGSSYNNNNNEIILIKIILPIRNPTTVHVKLIIIEHQLEHKI